METHPGNSDSNQALDQVLELLREMRREMERRLVTLEAVVHEASRMIDEERRRADTRERT